MVSASFQQTSFLGGEWSPTAYGRKTDRRYQMSMSLCRDWMPIEEGSLTRRPGFRFLGITRHGAAARLQQFDFSTTQPYQIELSDGMLRLWAGLSLVVDDDSDGYTIVSVSTDTPAVVTISGMPDDFADGNTVFFKINSEPCSAPFLCNQQFTIGDVDTGAGTFTLSDAISGAPIDGTLINFGTSTFLDKVFKVFELATPYVGTDWQQVRATHNDTSVTLFHPKYAPRVLELDVDHPFKLTTATFYDGPYMDINTTTTTLTPSGTSGSITMTASSTTGINNDQGFLATDLGRLIRFQSAPPAWDSGATYNKNAIVEGSDNNIYSALKKSTNVDPTTDDGTTWLVTGQEPQWGWMTITHVTDTTHVTCLIGGVTLSQETETQIRNSLSSTVPQSVWQLGFFSDTTGWPTIGEFHDGRLWLANAIQANRLDASVSDGGLDENYFNFTPTAFDGTVADDNGIAAVANANEVNAVFWLLSTGDGLMIGTQGAEFRIRASALDDPISDTNITFRRVSKFGSTNAEALIPWGRPLFLQRHQRKLLALRQTSEITYDGDNVSHLASQFMAPGIAEIRWQQEPTLTVWLRQNDGGLCGCVYRSSAYNGYSMSQDINDENFEGFFGVDHAYGRSFDSISTGPSYDGLSDALYAVTNQESSEAPDFGVHHVEYLMPLFDESQADWQTFFVDGGVSPCCGTKRLRSNGDSFNGVQLYGLTYLNGLQVSIVIGGLDCGDYTVANGSVIVPFQGETGNLQKLFTEAFFDATDDGTDYGAWGTDLAFVHTSSGEAPPHPANSFGSYGNFTTNHHNYSFADQAYAPNEIYGVDESNGVFDTYDFTTFTLKSSLSLSTAVGGRTISAAAYYADEIGFHYITVTGGVLQFTPDGSSQAFIATDGAGGTVPDVRSFMLCPNTRFMLTTGVDSVSTTAQIRMFNTETMTWYPYASGYHWAVDEDHASICVGRGTNMFFQGIDNDLATGASFGLYSLDVEAPGSFSKLATVAPADIDATWTHFTNIGNMVYDNSDGCLIFGVSGNGTTTSYLCKFNPGSKAFVWKTANVPVPDFAPIAVKQPLASQHLGFFNGDNATGGGMWYIKTSDGTQDGSLLTGPTVFLADGPSFFDQRDASVTVWSSEAAWSGSPTPLGAWSQAKETSGISHGAITKLYFGLTGDEITTTRVYHSNSSAGLAYPSKAMLLPPDYGYDAGARNGPAFGKKRRLHWYAFNLYRSQKLSIAVDGYVLHEGEITTGTKMRPVPLNSQGGKALLEPALFSGTLSTTIDSDYSFEGKASWEVSRPYPAQITVFGGYIESEDK